MNILLVEDSTVSMKCLEVLSRSYFEDLHLNIEKAYDGEQAYNMFKANPTFDLIFLDITMPVLDGIGFLKLIRSEFGNYPPIIIVSAVADEYTPELEFKNIFSVSKPITKERLNRALRRLSFEDKNL